MKQGFDNDLYLEEQRRAILERVTQSGTKLYLEFGGKLLHDYHASRVLPGFDPNVKMKLLQTLSGQIDIILCIYAGDIERKKVRADFGITYDADAMKLIDDLRDWNLDVTAVVITRYTGEPAAKAFKERLERRGITVYTHRPIQGYPVNVDLIVSDEGYGANAYIRTTHPLVVVTAPGPNSGKLSTCLSELYHDFRSGCPSGYAKFETFPIWNLPLNHPVNIAYEAATADLQDFNIIDPFHLEAYGRTAINYNRDVDAFPVLKTILERITGRKAAYQSPTDMGVNRAGFGITDDEVVRAAAKQEIVRRYYRYRCEYAMGFCDKTTAEHAEMIMRKANVGPEQRPVAAAAEKAAVEASRKGKGNNGICCGTALELSDGTLITGSNSPLMHAASSVVLNAVKHLAGLPDDMHLLSPGVLNSIATFKGQLSGKHSASLDLQETLIALCMSASTNPSAQVALDRLALLRHCDAHSTHMPSPGDEAGLRKLGIQLTSDPRYPSRNLHTD